ncbi:hypothetical protein GCM10010273_18640 [Streptomyces lavendulocolor]
MTATNRGSRSASCIPNAICVNTRSAGPWRYTCEMKRTGRSQAGRADGVPQCAAARNARSVSSASFLARATSRSSRPPEVSPACSRAGSSSRPMAEAASFTASATGVIMVSR